MARLLIQFPGSTTATVSAETLPKNVIVVDEDLHQLRVHDGVTPGGHVVSGGGGISNIDELTITMNADDEIQTIGVRNQNTANGATAVLYDWEGSLEEYIDQDIATLHPEWVCYINDDGDGGEGVYTKEEIDILLAGKVDTNLNNFSYVANCITEIPQDIKLELNNGVLKLKAGSKVYVPNGSGVFDVLSITNDTSVTQTVNGSHLVYVNTGQALWAKKESGFVSGDTTPPAIGDGVWYNTTANRIEWYTGTGWSGQGGRSFPIAKVTVSNGAISNIDQVFNGFGYIGSSVFALPGLKALAPNGRNADGSLKNQLITVSSVLTSFNYGTSENRLIILTNAPILQNDSRYVYNAEENKIYWTGDGKAYIRVILGSIDVNSSAKITSFNPKQVFHAVDYNDGDFVVSSMEPSSENGYMWYRKYKSGWVEQGGRYDYGSLSADFATTITIPVVMSDNNYTALVSASRNNENAAYRNGYCTIFTKNATQLGFGFYGQDGQHKMQYLDWYIAGKSAV